MEEWWAEVGIGVGAGFLGGILGLGGGFIMVPGLVLLLDLPQREAQGAALVGIAVIAFVSTIINLRRGLVDHRTAPTIGLAAIAASALGGVMAGFMPDEVLRRIFGAILALIGVEMALSTLKSSGGRSPF